LGPEARDGIERYLKELSRWAASTNLVGSTDYDALRLHVAQSLAASSRLPRNTRVADLGSGAGFPGLPLLITRPDLRMTLVEIRTRRVSFLRHVVRTLGLDCVVLRQKLENPPESRFQVTLLRAVAPVQRALQIAEPWTEGDGEIWIWTREEASAVGAAYVGEISLGAGGRILRARAAAVSRGTL